MTCHYQSISLTTSKDNNVALRLVWLVSKSFSNIKHFYVPAGSRLWNILSFSSSKLSNLKHVLSGNGLTYFFQSFSNLRHVVSSSEKSTLGYFFFKSKTCFMFQLETFHFCCSFFSDGSQLQPQRGKDFNVGKFIKIFLTN